jgi:uncharacterized protein YecE (DUF72 family)
MVLRIGTAGWTIPRDSAEAFPPDGSHLARYAGRFNAVEINSSFHRPHRPATYARWAAAVPDDFRFAVKMPKAVTHEGMSIGPVLKDFLDASAELGDKRGPILVQLPPKASFDPASSKRFLDGLRRMLSGSIALEPRHASWFTPAVSAFLAARRIARVAADPPRAGSDSAPGGWGDLAYHRLHGSPVIYRSSYSSNFLADLGPRLATAEGAGIEVWCIFDNTTLSAATANALSLQEQLAGSSIALTKSTHRHRAAIEVST